MSDGKMQLLRPTIDMHWGLLMLRILPDAPFIIFVNTLLNKKLHLQARERSTVALDKLRILTGAIFCTNPTESITQGRWPKK